MSRICPIIFGRRYFWLTENHHHLIVHQQLQYWLGFSFERHCEHRIRFGAASSGWDIFSEILWALELELHGPIVLFQVAPEALLDEKNFFLALGIHKPHQVQAPPKKQQSALIYLLGLSGFEGLIVGFDVVIFSRGTSQHRFMTYIARWDDHHKWKPKLLLISAGC